MKTLLDTAFDEAKKLSPEAQNWLAEFILEELKNDNLWDEKFQSSQAQLNKWANKVRQEIKNGNIVNKGIDEL